MTLDEAIKGSEEAVIFLGNHNQKRLAFAATLGLEALNAVKQYRKNPHAHQVYRLQGETEE